MKKVTKFAKSPIIQFCMIGTICALMMGVGQGGRSDANYRTPPSWGPDQADRYPFRVWQRHILIWSILTDLDPRRKAAAVIMRLTGGAADLVETIPLRPLSAAAPSTEST